MLFRELLIQELNEKRDDFARFAASQSDEQEDYLALLRELTARTSVEIRRNLGTKEDVGALPSDELDEFRAVSAAFETRWKSHEEARSWALEILKNRTTFAADASQILPGREISLPVAAIQVGTFENSHTETGDYKKQARFTVIPPNELLDSDELEEKPVSAESIVGLRRFQAEAEAVKTFLRNRKGWRERGERMPLAFFDGTLLISIAMPRTSLQTRFVAEMVELVRVSEETRVPVVGFVDQSYARDLISLLDALSTSFGRYVREPNRTLNDSRLLNVESLKSWGDRTPFFYCRRHGLSDFYGETVGFVYLKTSGDGVPARLDVPSWIYEGNLLAEVLDGVRAECVIGLGYPYALETADATAVISGRDREMFLRALQDFAARENLNFRVASKRMSKARRR
ncbi:MAG TPA: DNA double-strand break repair nuclease NurA [Pyrinomonadaceae bacterium]|nr:DNA double-strand break repair nuclease NurA [Pyrinomonadaceae bacterium]